MGSMVWWFGGAVFRYFGVSVFGFACLLSPSFCLLSPVSCLLRFVSVFRCFSVSAFQLFNVSDFRLHAIGATDWRVLQWSKCEFSDTRAQQGAGTVELGA